MREKIERELKELAISARNNLNRNRHIFSNNPEYAYEHTYDQIKIAQIEYASFRTKALNLIGKLFGTDEDHYTQLEALSETFFNYPECLRIVQAASDGLDA